MVDLMDYFKTSKSSVSISYEYDPTDVLKIPQLLAEAITRFISRKKMKMTLLVVVLWDREKNHMHIGEAAPEKRTKT
jgi:hypothetical protein